MDDWRQPPLVLLAIAGFLVLFGFLIVPGAVDSGVGDLEQSLSDLPQPVVLGIITVGAIAVWITMMYVLGKVLYWVWQQIDDYVLSFWDLVLPEHPFIRFGAGVTVMLFLFVFGPMAVLMQTDLLQDEDQVDIEGNGTDAEDTPTPAQNQTNSGVTVIPNDDFDALGRQTVG